MIGIFRGWGIWTIDSISCDIYTLHDAIYCNLSADSGSRALESHHIVEKYGFNFHGVQALDHLKYICDGAFERLFGSGKGEIWGLPWVMLKLRFDRYIMTTFFVASDAFALVLTSQQHSLLSSTMGTYRCPEVLLFWRGVTGWIATHNSLSLSSNVP